MFSVDFTTVIGLTGVAVAFSLFYLDEYHPETLDRFNTKVKEFFVGRGPSSSWIKTNPANFGFIFIHVETKKMLFWLNPESVARLPGCSDEDEHDRNFRASLKKKYGLDCAELELPKYFNCPDDQLLRVFDRSKNEVTLYFIVLLQGDQKEILRTAEAENPITRKRELEAKFVTLIRRKDASMLFVKDEGQIVRQAHATLLEKHLNNKYIRQCFVDEV